MFNNLVEVLEFQMNETQKGVFFIKSKENEKFISYQTLYQKAKGILHNLQSKGLSARTEVILQIEDDKEFLYALWACILGGMTPLPMPVGNTPEHKLRILRIWESLDNPFLLTTHEIDNDFEKISESNIQKKISQVIGKKTVYFDEVERYVDDGKVYYAKPNDPAIIMFSSGSTGNPKGVILTHDILISGEEVLIDLYQLNKEDITLNWMPLTHTVGITFTHILPLLCGLNQYLLSKNLFIQNPMLWMTKVSQHKATILMVPTFGMKLFLSSYKPELATDWDLSHLKLVTSAGEAISKQIVDQFSGVLARFGMRKNVMCPIYGITETQVVATGGIDEGITAITLDRQALYIGAKAKETKEDGISFVKLGYPPNGCQIRICNDEDGVLEDGIVGHIQVKGRTVTPGYYKDDEQTKTAFTKGGWFRTGDVGLVNKGKIIITGRAKEIVIVNAANYYLSDIEQVASSVSGIVPGSIVACGVQNHDRMSDEVLIFVLTKEALNDFTKKAIEIKNTVQHKLGLEVKSIVPVESIPRTAMGKPNKMKLKEMYDCNAFDHLIQVVNSYIEEEKLQQPVEQPYNDIEEKLVEIWHKILGTKTISVNDDFFEIGGQSINVFQMIDEIIHVFSVTLMPRAVFEKPTIKDIALRIREQM